MMDKYKAMAPSGNGTGGIHLLFMGLNLLTKDKECI
jgi:hypothetical protein